MSKNIELKNQNLDLNMGLVDVLIEILPKSKYVEFAINLIKNKRKQILKDELLEMVQMSFGIDEEKLIDKNSNQLYCIFRNLDNYFCNNEFTSLLKFIELNEKKCIENSDLTTYKTFEDVDMQLSIAELKQLDKSLEKQIVKIYEDSEWLVLKPLTWESSKKYGSNTKWCTTSENEDEYFYRYARNGILIYYLNKKTGNKVASFRDLTHEGEISFWNIRDRRIDSIESGLPFHIIEIFKEFCLSCDVSNWGLMTVDEQTTIMLMMETRNVKKTRENEPSIVIPIHAVPPPDVMDEEEVDRILEDTIRNIGPEPGYA